MSAHPYHYLLLSLFKILAILVEVKWYLIGILSLTLMSEGGRGGEEMTYSRSGLWEPSSVGKHWTPSGGSVIGILPGLWFLLIFRPSSSSLSTEFWSTEVLFDEVQCFCFFSLVACVLGVILKKCTKIMKIYILWFPLQEFYNFSSFVFVFWSILS